MLNFFSFSSNWRLLLLNLNLGSVCVDAAYVRTSQCGDSTPKPFQDNPWHDSPYSQISAPIAQVILKDVYLVYRLEFTADVVLNDANYTTNLYTTLNVKTKFIGGDVYEKSLRLCDYIASPFDAENGTLYSNYDDDMDQILQQIPELFGPFENGGDVPVSNTTTTSSEPPRGAPFLPQSISSKLIERDLPSTTSSSSQLTPSATATDNYKQICPLQPQQRYQFIYVAKIDRPRYFGSYQTTFKILSANVTEDSKESNIVGCVDTLVTPYHPKYITYTVCFLVMAIFIFGLVVSFFIYHCSPNQESSNVFLIQASSICNGPLLNELTPDVSMLLNFIQFVVLSACLNLAYPGFLRPILTFMNWCCLIRVDLFGQHSSGEFINPDSQDGIYNTLGHYGLLAIFPQSYRVGNQHHSPPPPTPPPTPPIPDSTILSQTGISNKSLRSRLDYGEMISDLWRDFMVWLWCIIALAVILSIGFMIFKQRHRISSDVIEDDDEDQQPLRPKTERKLEYQSMIYYSMGIVVQFFYVYFSLPFISITSFLILGLCLGLDIDVTCAVFALLFLIIWISIISWFIIGYVLRDQPVLYSSFKIISTWSTLYNWYKPEKSWFLIIEKFKTVFQGLIIGCGQQNGIAQLVLLLLLEISHLFLVLVYQPYFNKVKNIWCCCVILASIVLLFTYVPYIKELNVDIVPRSIMGNIQLIIFAIVILVFFVFFCIRMIQVYSKRKKFNNGYSNSIKNHFTNEPGAEDEVQYHEEEEELHKITPTNLKKETINDTVSINTEDLHFTDFRAVSTLMLTKNIHNPDEYTHDNESEHPPMRVSPITEEYLTKMQDRDDYEIKTLWKRRIKKMKGLQYTRYDTSSSVGTWVSRLKPRERTEEKGFSVIGRKPIVMRDHNFVDEERKKVNIGGSHGKEKKIQKGLVWLEGNQ